MDFSAILNYLATLAPWAPMVLTILGGLVVLAIVVDGIIPDEKDHGFSKKLLALPIIGPLLNALKAFSPFNTRNKK